MRKNPFKKQSVVNTLVNVGIGGAANVAIDYIWDTAGLDTSLQNDKGDRDVDSIKNAIKVVGGAVVGSMISDRYGRAAADGVAVVGVSNLIAGLMTSKEEKEKTDKTPAPAAPTGLPGGTIGAIRAGSAAYARAMRQSCRNNGTSGFMSK